jgi:hypothetical protein
VTGATLFGLLVFVGVFVLVDVLLVEVQPLFASLTDFAVADERMTEMSMESTSLFILVFCAWATARNKTFDEGTLVNGVRVPRARSVRRESAWQDSRSANGIAILLESNPTVHIVAAFKMAMVTLFGVVQEVFHRSCSFRPPG